LGRKITKQRERERELERERQDRKRETKTETDAEKKKPRHEREREKKGTRATRTIWGIASTCRSQNWTMTMIDEGPLLNTTENYYY
jgi:hypothetical protein